MKIPTYCTFLVALAVLPASAQTPAAPPSTSAPRSSASKPSSLSAAEKAFVMDAATGGMAEVELGKMAAEKAASADVKQFGQRMADDHGKANGELQALAGQKGVTLPTEPTAAQKATSARLPKTPKPHLKPNTLQNIKSWTTNKKSLKSFHIKPNNIKMSLLSNNYTPNTIANSKVRLM